MSAYESLSDFIEDKGDRYLQLIFIIMLITVGVVYGIYSDRSGETSSNPGIELEGIEHDQDFDESNPSEIYIVKLANGDRHHYWRTQNRTDQGFIEIKSKLSLFDGNKSNYTGLDYRPKGKVCVREISNTNIDLYQC